jgi:hypothetical protein
MALLAIDKGRNGIAKSENHNTPDSIISAMPHLPARIPIAGPRIGSSLVAFRCASGFVIASVAVEKGVDWFALFLVGARFPMFVGEIHEAVPVVFE